MEGTTLFKVENIAEMKNYVTRMNDRTAEMNEVKSKAMSSLSNLQNNIQCDGIKDTLNSLSQAINTNTQTVNNLFQEISGFINNQMLKYEEANAAAKSGLEGVQSQLDETKAY